MRLSSCMDVSGTSTDAAGAIGSRLRASNTGCQSYEETSHATVATDSPSEGPAGASLKSGNAKPATLDSSKKQSSASSNGFHNCRSSNDGLRIVASIPRGWIEKLRQFLSTNGGKPQGKQRSAKRQISSTRASLKSPTVSPRKRRKWRHSCWGCNWRGNLQGRAVRQHDC